jgi:hypothetical protein
MTSTTHTGSVSSQNANAPAASQRFAPRSLERVVPSLIFVLCFGYLCIFRHYSTLEPDEGIVLQGAERIIAGQIPYRDFFSFYTPGTFYLLAFLFRVFGDSFAVARISLAVVGAICSVITYLLARRVCPPGVAVFAAVLTTTAGMAFRFLVLHNPYSTLGCCLCLYAAIRLLETRKPYWAFATGSLASLTFLFEQSKGAGLFTGLILGFLVLRFVAQQASLQGPALSAAAFGLLWPLAITFGYFGVHHALSLMAQSWLWPLHHYTQANRVTYGYQNWSDHTREVIFHSGPVWLRVIKVLAVSPGLLIPVLPLVAVGLLFYWTVQIRRQSEVSAQSQYYVLVCSVLSGLLLSVVIVRADILHFMYLAPLWYAVLAWILGARGVRSAALNALRVPLIAFIGTTFGLLSMAVLFATTGADNRIETRKGIVMTGRDTVIDYVQSHVAPGRDVLVYPYLPLYNYLTETLSPSRYDYFQPGMNTSEQAEEIIASLQSTGAPILFEPRFSEKIANSWPETSLSAMVNDPVSDYIARNYRVCQILVSPEGWRFQFMVRNEVACR